jgi:hypothetical protein
VSQDSEVVGQDNFHQDLPSRVAAQAKRQGVKLTGVGELSFRLPSGKTFKAKVNKPRSNGN